MKKKNQVAFKEWAAVVRALEKGQQIFLLRKGGIAEEGGVFQIEETEFFLFPTFEHQEKEKLKPQAQILIDESKKQADLWAGKVGLSCYAEVVDIFQFKTLDPLLGLSQYYIWTDELVRERFNWRSEEPIYVLLLRVYRLENTLLIDSLERYGGCKSWIGFDRPIPTKGAKTVLGDMEFELRVERIRTALQQ